MRSFFVASLAILFAGCGDELEHSRAENSRLATILRLKSAEIEAMQQTLPQERPAVLVELDVVKKQADELRGELAAARQALASARESTKGEVLPLSAWMKSIDAQMADHNARINGCSKRGHTHTYHKGDSVFHSNTDPER
jgi:hypothetical protein